MEDKIALFDMDRVIADHDSKLIKDLEEIGTERPINLYGNLPNFIKKRIWMIREQEGWWRDLPVIESGLELMRLCVEIGFGIHILTQGPKKTMAGWGEKYEWCEKYVAPIYPDYGITVTRNGKGLHYGRVLVDDYPIFMKEWLEHRPRGLGLMPNLFVNKGFSHPNIVKYNPEGGKWRSAELEDKLRKVYERNSGESFL